MCFKGITKQGPVEDLRMKNEEQARRMLSHCRHEADMSAFAPYYTLVVLWHILFNKLVVLTPQTNCTWRKLRVSAFQQYNGWGVADRVFISENASDCTTSDWVFSWFLGPPRRAAPFWKIGHLTWFLCKAYGELGLGLGLTWRNRRLPSPTRINLEEP
jgi:hypothetical protein